MNNNEFEPVPQEHKLPPAEYGRSSQEYLPPPQEYVPKDAFHADSGEYNERAKQIDPKAKRFDYKKALKYVTGAAATVAVAAAVSTYEQPAQLVQPAADQYVIELDYPHYFYTVEAGKDYCVWFDEAETDAYYDYLAAFAYGLTNTFTDETAQGLISSVANGEYHDIVTVENGMAVHGRTSFLNGYITTDEIVDLTTGIEYVNFGAAEVHENEEAASATLTVLNKMGSIHESTSFFQMNSNIDLTYTSDLDEYLHLSTLTELLDNYRGSSYDEIREYIAEVLDADDSIWQEEWYRSLVIERSTAEFSIESGSAVLMLPQFLKIECDSDYGYSRQTLQAGQDYFIARRYDFDHYLIGWDHRDLLTRAVLDKAVRFDESTLEYRSSVIDRILCFEEGGQICYELYPMAYERDIQKNIMYGLNYSITGVGADRNMWLQATSPRCASDYLIRVNEDTDVILSKYSKLIPVYDTYYDYQIADDTYTITNTADDPAVILYNTVYADIDDYGLFYPEGNSVLVREELDKLAERSGYSADIGINRTNHTVYNRILDAGDSVKVSPKGSASLTLPECCTLTASGGDIVEPSGVSPISGQ